MTSKRFQKEIDREKRRKNGVRRWKSELARFGEDVLINVPIGLMAEVLEGTEFDLNLPLARETEFTEAARRVAPVVSSNPTAILESRMNKGEGNGGDATSESDLLTKLKAVAKPRVRLP